MRRVMTVLGVTAIVVLAAGAAQAGFILPYNSGGLPANGYDCSIFGQTFNNGPAEGYIGNYAGYSVWSNPAATVDGAMWINTGSGPTMLTTAVNADLWVDDPVASWGSGGAGTSGFANGWIELALLLNSDGSSANDFSAGWPGVFNGPANELSLPGTAWYWYYNHTGSSRIWPNTTFQMELYLWTGNETSYAAAVADGRYTAYANWSEPCFTEAHYNYVQVPPIPGDIDNPAMVLTAAPTPEPCTLLLAATGLAGLLAYAWRKRK